MDQKFIVPAIQNLINDCTNEEGLFDTEQFRSEFDKLFEKSSLEESLEESSDDSQDDSQEE